MFTAVSGTPAGTVPAAQAIRAMSPFGDGRGPAVMMSLARVTNSVAAMSPKPRYALLNRLVWVLERDDVTLDKGGPTSHTPEPYHAVQQWLIDARTGKYVQARDFGERDAKPVQPAAISHTMKP
jgi:hypothetical protein